MTDVKNIITLGIGASPGGLIWFMTSGLESYIVPYVPNVPGCATLTISLVGSAAKTETLVGTATLSEKQCTL